MKKREVEAKMSSKGQVTLPKTIRTLLKVEEGDIIQFVVEFNRIFIQKASSPCPVCNGKKVILDNPCFFCLEKGELLESFNPLEYQASWYIQYGVESSYNLESLNGIINPVILFSSNNYSNEILEFAYDGFLMSLYKLNVINSEQKLPQFKTKQMQQYWEMMFSGE